MEMLLKEINRTTEMLPQCVTLYEAFSHPAFPKWLTVVPSFPGLATTVLLLCCLKKSGTGPFNSLAYSVSPWKLNVCIRNPTLQSQAHQML